MSSDEDRVARWCDKLEIQEVLARYCRGVDRCDEALIASVYHPGAIDDHGSWSRPGQELAGHIARQKREMVFCLHRLSNHLVEIEPDGVTAVSEAAVQSVQRAPGEDVIQLSWSRYLDRFEKRDGVWRIAYRLLVHDAHTTIPAVDAWVVPGLNTDDFTWGDVAEKDVALGRRELLFPPHSLS